jgi:hypothetical protein
MSIDFSKGKFTLKAKASTKNPVISKAMAIEYNLVLVRTIRVLKLS